MGTTNTTYAVIADGKGGLTVQFVDFGIPVTGPYVPCSPPGSFGATPLVQYNVNLPAQLSRFLAKHAAGKPTILTAIGDSITKGFGATATSANIVQLSYPAALVQTLNAQAILADYTNFVGADDLYGVSVDFRLQFLPTAQLGAPLAGGYTVSIQPSPPLGFSFTADQPAPYDQVTITYLDSGTGRLELTLDTTPPQTLQLHGTNTIRSQSFAFPAGQYTKLTATLGGAQAVYIQTAALANSKAPAIQVYNAGSGGMTTEGEISPPGQSPLDGALALAPDLALLNLGTNDILFDVPVATTIDNLGIMITKLQQYGADVMLFVPLPTSDPRYMQEIPNLRVGLQSLSRQFNIPLIDLGQTYNNSYAELSSAGLMSPDGIHANATLYADIGSQLGTLLAGAIKP